VMYMNTGQYDQAEETMREVVRQYEQKYGTEHRVVAASYQNLATVFSRQRRYAEAIPLHRKAFEIYAAVADEHLAVHAFPLLSLAFAELGLGEFAAAEATARRALGMLDEAAAGAYPVGAAKCFVALAMEGQGRRDEARQMLDAAHRLLIGSTVRDPYRSACRLPEP
ncbi:MAG TPA: tetratricopeptide repeat protein, partial [Woeseiaceae bacterium]|nr:tetratricopeptide repeat protein [Woeseiaceae bacterium]